MQDFLMFAKKTSYERNKTLNSHISNAAISMQR